MSSKNVPSENVENIQANQATSEEKGLCRGESEQNMLRVNDNPSENASEIDEAADDNDDEETESDDEESASSSSDEDDGEDEDGDDIGEEELALARKAIAEYKKKRQEEKEAAEVSTECGDDSYRRGGGKGREARRQAMESDEIITTSTKIVSQSGVNLAQQQHKENIVAQSQDQTNSNHPNIASTSSSSIGAEYIRPFSLRPVGSVQQTSSSSNAFSSSASVHKGSSNNANGSAAPSGSVLLTHRSVSSVHHHPTTAGSTAGDDGALSSGGKTSASASSKHGHKTSSKKNNSTRNDDDPILLPPIPFPFFNGGKRLAETSSSFVFGEVGAITTTSTTGHENDIEKNDPRQNVQKSGDIRSSILPPPPGLLYQWLRRDDSTLIMQMLTDHDMFSRLLEAVKDKKDKEEEEALRLSNVTNSDGDDGKDKGKGKSHHHRVPNNNSSRTAVLDSILHSAVLKTVDAIQTTTMNNRSNNNAFLTASPLFPSVAACFVDPPTRHNFDAENSDAQSAEKSLAAAISTNDAHHNSNNTGHHHHQSLQQGHQRNRMFSFTGKGDGGMTGSKRSHRDGDYSLYQRLLHIENDGDDDEDEGDVIDNGAARNNEIRKKASGENRAAVPAATSESTTKRIRIDAITTSPSMSAATDEIASKGGAGGSANTEIIPAFTFASPSSNSSVAQTAAVKSNRVNSTTTSTSNHDSSINANGATIKSSAIGSFLEKGDFISKVQWNEYQYELMIEKKNKEAAERAAQRKSKHQRK